MLRGVLAVVLLLLVLVPRSTAVGRFPVSTVAASFGIRGGERTDDTSIEATTTTTTGATCPEILEDKVVYRGWRTITQRKVKMRNGKIVDFDVSGSRAWAGLRSFPFFVAKNSPLHTFRWISWWESRPVAVRC